MSKFVSYSNLFHMQLTKVVTGQPKMRLKHFLNTFYTIFSKKELKADKIYVWKCILAPLFCLH